MSKIIILGKGTIDVKKQLEKKYGHQSSDERWLVGTNRLIEIKFEKGINIFHKEYCSLVYTYLPLLKQQNDDELKQRKAREENVIEKYHQPPNSTNTPLWCLRALAW